MAKQIIKYYSAHICEATATKGTRMVIQNRDTGVKREYAWDHGVPSINGLRGQVIARHHSPILNLDILWEDKILDKLFFRTIEDWSI